MDVDEIESLIISFSNKKFDVNSNKIINGSNNFISLKSNTNFLVINGGFNLINVSKFNIYK